MRKNIVNSYSMKRQIVVLYITHSERVNSPQADHRWLKVSSFAGRDFRSFSAFSAFLTWR